MEKPADKVVRTEYALVRTAGSGVEHLLLNLLYSSNCITKISIIFYLIAD